MALPVLEAVAALEGEEDLLSMPELARRAGVEVDLVMVEVDRLLAGGYLGGEVNKVMMGGDPEGVRLMDPVLLERGARAVGVWPTDDPFDGLLTLIDRRLLDDSLDAETRTKLQRFRGVLVDVGKGAAGGLLAALIRAQLGV